MAAALLAAGAAQAQEARDFCPDRPGLGTPACTIDEGRFAVELGILDWTLDRSRESRSDEIAAADLLVRYGLTDSLEAQVGWTAFAHARERDRLSGAVERDSGTGDLLVAFRQNLRNPDGSGLSVAVMPYATVPIGSFPAGAGDWGAGLIVPLSYELPKGFQLGFTATVDAAVDEDRDGRHLAYGGIAGLDVPLADALGATFELAATRDRDPAGTSTQLLGGVSAGWAATDDLQIDAGTNIGLDDDAPDLELYFGVAARF